MSSKVRHGLLWLVCALLNRSSVLLLHIILGNCELRDVHLLVNITNTRPILWSQELKAIHVVLHPPAWSIHRIEVLGRIDVLQSTAPVTLQVVSQTLVPLTLEVWLHVLLEADEVMINLKHILAASQLQGLHLHIVKVVVLDEVAILDAFLVDVLLLLVQCIAWEYVNAVDLL